MEDIYNYGKAYTSIIITKIQVRDIRFPTSDTLLGSDALHSNPDYSAAYVQLYVEDQLSKTRVLPIGTSLTFTIGKGTELLVKCIELLSMDVIGLTLSYIINNFADYYYKLSNEPQLRWIGPEKGDKQRNGQADG